MAAYVTVCVVLTDPRLVLAVLLFDVALAEWLAAKTALRHLGPALLVILIAALQVNLGLLPVANATYSGVFAHGAPLAIFLLLLGVHLASVLRAGLPLVGLFVIGSLGTTLGITLGWWAAGGVEAFGERAPALAGMFVGTYTGGSVNFNAVALEYGVANNGNEYIGATVVDNIATVLWMAATLLLPRTLARFWPTRTPAQAQLEHTSAEALTQDEESSTPYELAALLGLGLVAVWGSGYLSAAWGVPSMILLTTIALGLAQVPALRRLRGSRMLGLLVVQLFLAVIGTLCDLEALGRIGGLAKSLSIMVLIGVSVHALVTLIAARLLRLDLHLVSIASQANIGGGTTAMALARSFGRADLVLPAILIGALGTALGNYLGIGTAELLASLNASEPG